KAERLYKGRQKTAQQHKETILKLHGQGMGVAAILKEIRATQDEKGKSHKIGQSSVYAILAEQRRQANGGASRNAPAHQPAEPWARAPVPGSPNEPEGEAARAAEQEPWRPQSLGRVRDGFCRLTHVGQPVRWELQPAPYPLRSEDKVNRAAELVGDEVVNG